LQGKTLGSDRQELLADAALGVRELIQLVKP